MWIDNVNEEIEIKVALKNPEEVLNKLSHSAKFVKDKRQKDEYFVPKHNDFFAVKNTVEYLRIRSQDGKAEIGYHFCHLAPDGSLLKTDEYETKVDDPQMMSTILKKLDMILKVTVTKDRKYFDYKDFEVLVDNVENLGYFLEVEAKNVVGDIGAVKKSCYVVLDELGVKWEKLPDMGYPDLLLEKMSEN
ncbi:MAG: class IV adenylate cyclase [Candidatus Woesearchaeota archaeon]